MKRRVHMIETPFRFAAAQDTSRGFRHLELGRWGAPRFEFGERAASDAFVNKGIHERGVCARALARGTAGGGEPTERREGGGPVERGGDFVLYVGNSVG